MADFLMATPMATDLTASSSTSQIPITMPTISTSGGIGGTVRTPTMTQEGARFFQQLGFLDPATSAAVGLNGNGHSFGHVTVDLQSPSFNTSSIVAHRNSTKTLKCPKCNWHYKYQEALENHLKDKHPDVEITCRYCIHNQVHPKLARGESYSCGYKPFRCAICNYSTTTKGNLSIHMQSDKHLHAMQEVPSTIVPSGRGPSTTDPADNKPFHCLICGNFTTDSTDALYDHINIDRSQTNSSDMSAVHGVYQCFLCPYTTNLKANFQLHTRTDKHIQRVHMINHMRENPHFAGTSTSALLCRVAASKSGVQIRCRPCNEALSSVDAIRDHCSQGHHMSRLDFMQKSSALTGFGTATSGIIEDTTSDCKAVDLSSGNESEPSFTLNYTCKFCSFSTSETSDAINHCELHKSSLLSKTDTPNGSTPTQLRDQIPEEDDELTSLVDMTDASLRLKCHQCSDFYTANLSDLETPTEDPATSSEPATTPDSDPETANPRCPLCDEPKPATALESHLLLDHRIAADVAKKLMLAGPSSGTVAVARVASAVKPCDHQNGTHPPASAYNYHCQACPMVFRTEEGFQKHTLKHVFDAAHKCTRCNRTFKSMFSLRHHLTNKHGLTAPAAGSNELRCSICQEEYPDRIALQAHVYSLDHLHRAKKFLEEQNSGKFGQQLSDQILSMLALVPNQQKPQSTQSPPNSNTFDAKKPYKCNVCYLSYSQGSSLDIHLRSVAHQTRIGRLAELLATGEVEAHLPVSEQPGGIPQKTIGDLVLPATNTEIEKLACSTSPMDAAAVVATTSSASPLPRKRKFDPEDAAGSSASSPLATFNNIMNMSHLLGQLSGVGAPVVSADNVENGLPELSSALGMTPAQVQSLFSAATAGTSSASASPEPVSDLPSTGKALRHALETFGIDLVEQFFEDIQSVKSQIDLLPDSAIADLCQVDCPNCSDVFGSLWILKNHASEAHSSSLPLEAVQQFSEKLKSAIADNKDKVNAANGPDAKRSKIEKITSSLKAGKLSASKPVSNAIPNGKKLSNGTSPPPASTSTSSPMPNLAMMQMMAGAAGFPMLMPHFLSMMNPADMFSGANPMTSSAGTSNGSIDSSAYGQQRRARTKITDDQLKVLKTYFDISNSPTEAQVKEMSMKTGLAEKVIKHWFRNTLFKERQRDKDSPYNFNVPPQLSIDLDTYEKTGEAKVKTVVKVEDSDDFSIQSTPPTTVPTPTPSITSQPPKLSCAGGIKSEVDDSPPTSTAAFVNAASEFMAHLNKAVNNNFVNPFALLGQGAMNDGNSPLSLVNPASGLDGHSSGSGNSNSSGTGRRANRTRFTDVQLRSLQQFFDKQAYPKDDDLEMLSKRLNLSPRVIVVWFQNARQKARKIYENTPNMDNNERFIRTPGQNFQCKRCQLVFPRYYELIQHQQKVCYKNDTDKQRADNKSVDEQLSDEEKPTTSYDNGNTVTATVTAGAPLNLAGLPGSEEPSQPVASSMETLAQLVNSNTSTDSDSSSIALPQPATCSSEDLFKLLTSANPSDTLAKLLGNSAASVMPTTPAPSNERFAKRCPFCVTAIFTSRSRLTEHMATKHLEQIRIANVDIDALPDVPEDEMNQSSTTSSFNNSDPLDLTSSSRGSPAPGERRDSLNGLTGYNDADFDFSSVLSSVSPSMLATGLFTNNGFNMPIRTPSAGGSASGSQGNAKRYRTHLTPLQVYVMKALFNDYKTPSMTECDILGNEIGLNKRVVQVWFQNARAKERKCRSVAGDEDLPKTSTEGCNICGVEFHGKASKTTMQDHIFTKKHISILAERFNSRSSSAQRDGSSNSNYRRDGSTSPSEAADRPRPRAVRDTSIRKPASTNSGNTRPSSASGFASQFPFGMMYGGLPPFMDPTIIGTPITSLQIPQTVMQQITNDIAAGKDSTLFTQDGLDITSLRARLSESDAKCAHTTTAEVGYACPGCSHTFQVQPALEAHQKMLCTTSEGKIFKLRQSYYECRRCSTKLGTQEEFKRHVETPAHTQMH